MLTLHVNPDILAKLDLAPFEQYIAWNPELCQYFNEKAGQEHYRLLAHVSSQLEDNTSVLDIGTYAGSSALALATNPTCHVYTYDILDSIKDAKNTIKDLPNVTCVLKDGMSELWKYIKCPLIVLDVDPHDGIQERAIIERLVIFGYKGVVLCDDIHINDAMNSFWDSVDKDKVDLTEYGHVTGTGAIIFDKEHVNIVVDA